MKLKSRKLWWTLAAFALACGVGSYSWLAIRATKARVDRPTAELIRLGMMREEVQQIISVPPGDYSIAIWRPSARRGELEAPYRYPDTPLFMTPPGSLGGN